MKKRITKYLMLLLTILAVLWLTPTVSFDQPFSKIMYDREGQLLGGKIAEDGQWRFAMIEAVPADFEMALLCFEDKRFYKHLGIDFASLSRAVIQNLRAGKVISGASTLTMQVCRMSRGNKPRNYTQKIIEMFMAIKLEMSHSKEEILQLHVSHAPFGGNVVGLEAASWRYYSKSPSQLSLSESALLAVLPNAPALIHPGRNRATLEAKRNRLLTKLLHENKIDSLNYELALLEPIPKQPLALPSSAPHLLEHLSAKSPSARKTTTTIDPKMQRLVLNTAEIYASEYQESDIQNLGILVLDTRTGEVLAYLGNSHHTSADNYVDMIQAHRSSGSVLKPLLYAAALDEGLISPQGLVKDVPLNFSGYRPQNYNKEFLGAVKADEALAKSLNLPAVDLLSRYKVPRFRNKLRNLGFSTIDKPANHYGLSLILGGADITLWDLTSSYASLGRTLLRYKEEQSRYVASDIHNARYLLQAAPEIIFEYEPIEYSAAAIHHTFQAMHKVSRPNTEGLWESFSSTKNLAWKTGTSFGHRDAWAVGVSPEYTIGIWVGNSDGEGKHSLVGVQRAAPILFDLVNKLTISDFPIPYDDLAQTAICTHSGYHATEYCNSIDSTYILSHGTTLSCPYHKQVALDNDGKRVHAKCQSPSEMHMEHYFHLPAEMAYYYQRHHPDYKPLPAYKADCINDDEIQKMNFIYPKKVAELYLPKNGAGDKEAAIFQVAHQDKDAILYWHLDDRYLGMTEDKHSMAILAEAGDHKLVLVDEDGHTIRRRFTILSE